MYDLIIRDATLVTPSGRQVADVAVAGGSIAYVGPRPRMAARAEVGAMGKFLIPGVIDGGVCFGSDGPQARVVAEETAAAVTGGVTTQIVLPSPELVDGSSAKTLRAMRGSARHASCHLAFWLDEGAADLVDEDDVVGVLATVRGDPPSRDRLASWGRLPGLFALHWCADPPPPESLLDVARARARARSRPLHLYAVTTTTELDWRDPVRNDVELTTTVTVPHLFLSADDPETTGLVATPPLRPEQDRRTLWTAVRRGRLDCVASHHHREPSQGIASTELLFPLMLQAARAGRLSLEQLVDVCCESPARIFGLARKGRVAKGFDADLVLFTEGRAERVDASTLRSPGRSPFGGREAAPKPELVIVGGRVVAERGELVDPRPVDDRAA